MLENNKDKYAKAWNSTSSKSETKQCNHFTTDAPMLQKVRIIGLVDMMRYFKLFLLLYLSRGIRKKSLDSCFSDERQQDEANKLRIGSRSVIKKEKTV